ncbi:hypothetical protein LTR85_008786 [Meristemomyces frigidus]|nr:hypothetical protein LTR85_008786 [Meristemomyces frigidus]
MAGMGPPLANKLRPFVFLNLPTELRLEIYGHLYEDVDRKAITIVREQRRFLDAVKPLLFGPSRSPQAPDMALIQTCRKVHNEIDDLPYQHAHFGLFLVDKNGRRHATQRLQDQIAGFGHVFINHIEFIQHLDLGVQDIGPHVPGGLLHDADPSILQRTAATAAHWMGGTLLSPSQTQATASSSRVLLVRAVKYLSRHLPNICCITLHDSVADQFGSRQTFLRYLIDLFPKLNELRVMRIQPGFGTWRFKVEDNHLIKWEDGEDTGRLLLGQKYQSL